MLPSHLVEKSPFINVEFPLKFFYIIRIYSVELLVKSRSD